MKKLVLGVTGPGSSRLMDGQVAYFINKGYDVYLMSPDHPKEHLFCKKEGCKHLPVDIEKDITPFQDIRALRQIIKHLRKVRPEVVNVGTPKMGLLGMIGASIVGIKKRIYTCRGLRYETEIGWKLRILKFMEKLTVQMAHKVVYVGPSLFKKSLANKTADRKKAVVIGKGSSNGVDLDYFNRENIDLKKKDGLRRQYGLEGCFVVGFAGRVSEHKGAFELVAVFESLYSNHDNLRLILMGHMDCPQSLQERIATHPGIIHIPFQDNVPLFMSLFDVLVLPSWREGFPNVPIQAAAMKIPVIVSDATGCIDSVSKGFNGKIFQKKDKESLQIALQDYINDPDTLQLHGVNGGKWAQKFKQEVIWDELENLYNK